MPILKIKKEDNKKRLDHFLVEKYPKESRSFWQKQIKGDLILVNDKSVKVHQFLKEGDKIKILKKSSSAHSQLDSKSKQASQGGQKNKKLKKLKYKLLHEDKHYLIVEKPAGLLTHSVKDELGLADQIICDYPEIDKVGEEYRWGIVHRLDKGVSGVLLVARSQTFFKYIKKQFKDRKIKKIYLALVYGAIEKDEGNIKFIIGRNKEGKMAARPQESEGKEAITHFEVLEKFQNYTYLQIQILTGRTHQIRAHMLAYSHPVVGDVLYKIRKQKIKEPCELGRIFLHSHIIGFKNLDKKQVEYKSKLPAKLEKCLKELK